MARSALVIEDAPSTVRALARLLHREGYTVATADTGPLRRLGGGKPPGENHFEITRRAVHDALPTRGSPCKGPRSPRPSSSQRGVTVSDGTGPVGVA